MEVSCSAGKSLLHKPSISDESFLWSVGSRSMPYEYVTAIGVLRLVRLPGGWTIVFNGGRGGQWPTADAATRAVARHQSGVPEWDQAQHEAPEDLLRWRPLGNSI
jgi:hypothetical protein